MAILLIRKCRRIICEVAFGLLITTVLALSVLSCTDSDSEQSGVVQIPQEEFIPHVTAEHIPVDTTRQLDDKDKGIPELDLIESANQDQLATFDELDVFVTSATYFHTYALSDRRLLFLDTHEFRLLEYDLNTHSYKRLAEHGQAPEDIQFSTDMTMDGDTLRVATPMFELTNFDCSKTPCEFAGLTHIDFAPLSLSQAGNHIAVLGEIPLEEDPGSLDELRGSIDHEVIRLVDRSGETKELFGAAYKSESWMARNRFLRESQVQYVEESDQYVLIFGALPYIYVYDGDFQFEVSFKITDFIQYYSEHDVERESVFHPSGRDRSTIRYIQHISDSYILLSVATAKQEEASLLRYYLLDLANKTSYFLSTQSASPLHYFVTDHGILVNHQGALYFRSY